MKPSEHDLEPDRVAGDAPLHARPPFVAEAIARFRAALVQVAAGEVDAARETLRHPDDQQVVDWYRSRVPGTRGRSAPVVEHSREREILERDLYHCRHCGGPLVHVEHLRRLQHIVGEDVLGELTGDEPRPSGGAPAATPLPSSALWLVIAATVDEVPAARRRLRRSGAEPVAACLPCRDGGVGASLAEPALARLHARRPDDLPDWHALLEALQWPAATPRALVHQVLLLDGSTLNISGEITGTVAHPAELRLTATAGRITVEGRVETRRGDTRTRFHGHVVLLDALRSDPLPERFDVALRSGGTPVGLVALPGCADTPNAAMTEPIPEVAGLGRRFRLDMRSGLVLRLGDETTRMQVVGVEVDDSGVSLEIAPSSPVVPEVDAVWLQQRDVEADASGRVDLVADATGRWRLGPGPRLVPTSTDGTVLWNVWATWKANGERRYGRVGRRASDLLAPRQAVRFPSMTARVDGTDIRVTPYFGAGRDLAVRVAAVRVAAVRPAGPT